MPNLIVKSVNGQLGLVHINNNLMHGAEEECACCPAECCHEIDGGTFDANGDLVFTTAALTAVVEMPTPNNRLVCDGDRLRITITLNSSVPTSSLYQYFYWLDRDWLHHSHGIQIGPDLHCGAHWRVWESNARTQTLEIDWTQCWMNYVETYGDICFGVIAGVPGEVLSLTFTERPVTVDCCEYNPICANCRYVLEDIGDPVGPELTPDGRTYWYDFPSGWSIKLVVFGVDEDHSFERGASLSVDIGVRPPKPDYARWPQFMTDSCVTAPGWNDLAGTQDHPRDTVPDFEPGTECFPNSHNITGDQCYERIRTPQPSTALKMAVSMTAAECIDDCGDERVPESIAIEVALPSEGGLILSAAVAVTDCPENDPAGEICCDIICEHECIVAAAAFDHLLPGHIVPGNPLSGFTYPAGTTVTFELVGHGIRTQDGTCPNGLPIQPLTFAWWVWSRCCKYLNGDPNPCPPVQPDSGEDTEVAYILQQLETSPTHIASCSEPLSCDTEPTASIVQQYFNYEFPCLVQDTDICNFEDETIVDTGIGQCCD